MLQMSHVGHAFLGTDSCGSKEPYIRWGPDRPREGALLRGDMRKPVVTYLRTNELRPPRVNVPAQQTQWTNAFTAARGGRTVMRPLARLL